MAQKTDYFEQFSAMTDFAVSAAENLHAILTDRFDPEQIKANTVFMHGIENAADAKKHELMDCVARDFITPIEREDIIRIANEIDNITDAIDDVFMRLYLFNIKELREEAIEFSEVIIELAKNLRTAMGEFHNFRRSKTLREEIIAINTLEEKGDEIYMRAVRRLFTEEPDASLKLAWYEIFQHMEECCDSCEHTADAMETVVMKNT